MEAEDLEVRFQEFAVDSSRFLSQIIGLIAPGGRDPSRLAIQNLETARTLLGKWCIRILVLLYIIGPMGFEGLRRRLVGISPRVLSRKLRLLEEEGMVLRTLIDSRPPSVRYSLTTRGETVARIGTPVFLFLSLTKVPRQSGSDVELLEHLRPLGPG
jgi:DNA-binding HxlR family transcriptional regulator